MTAGELTSFIMYAAITAGGVGVLAEVWGDVMRAAGATERLMELLSAAPQIAPPAQPRALPETQQARLQFDKVAFHYPSRPLTPALDGRSEEHASELQSLMRISYAVFCLKKQKHN